MSAYFVNLDALTLLRSIHAVDDNDLRAQLASIVGHSVAAGAHTHHDHAQILAQGAPQ